MTPILDYIPRLVEANRPYRVEPASDDLLRRSRFWVPGRTVTNQGSEGACVGHGVVNEAMASPVRIQPGNHIGNPNTEAYDVYRDAQQIDEWEGIAYEGTSVRAGMLVGRERGWWGGFRWAFNMAELRSALELGPVVIGVEWRAGMYDAPDGVLTAEGSVVGGHCLLVTGFSAPRAAYRLCNSWSKDWGKNGQAYIPAGELDQILFQSGGEAAVPVGRKLPA